MEVPDGSAVTLTASITGTATAPTYSWAGPPGSVPFPTADPDFANVTLLLHANGANGSTTITDSSLLGQAASVTAPAAISTTQSKFGGSSLLISGGSVAFSSCYTTQITGAFTLEGFYYRIGGGAGEIARLGAENPGRANIYWASDGALQIEVFSIGVYASTAGGAVSANVWTHIAVTRDGSGNLRMFANGIKVYDAAGKTAALGNASRISFNDTSGSFIDEFRFTNGVCRYTADFTVPTEAYPNSGVTSFSGQNLSWTFNGATDAGTYTVTATDGTAVDSPKSASLVLTPDQNAGDLWTSCVTTPMATDSVNYWDVAIGSSGRVVTAWTFFPAGGNGTDVPVIQCFNPQGDVLWSRRIGVDTLGINKIHCAIDNNNNCMILVQADNYLYAWGFGPTGTLLWGKRYAFNRVHPWTYTYYDQTLNRLIYHHRDNTNGTKWIYTAISFTDGSVIYSRELTVPGMVSNGFTNCSIARTDAGNYVLTLNAASFADGAGTLLYETDTSFTSIVRQCKTSLAMSYPNVVTDASGNIYMALSGSRIVVLSSTFAHVKTIQYSGFNLNNVVDMKRDLDGSIWAKVFLDLFSIGHDAALLRFNSDCSQLLQRFTSRVAAQASQQPEFSRGQWVNFAKGKFVRSSCNYSLPTTRGRHTVTCESLPLGDFRRRSSNGLSPTEFLDSMADDTPYVQALDVPTTIQAFSTATLGSSGITATDSNVGAVDGAGQIDRRRHTLQDSTTFLLHCNSAGASNGGVQTEDNSGQRVTLTRYSTGADPGTCFISNTQSVFGGYSLRLNGTDTDAGHLGFGAAGLTGGGGALNMATTIPFTIEWRARHDTLASAQAYFGTNNRTGGIRLVNSTTLEVNMEGTVATYTIPALSVDTWYAFALCAMASASPWNLRLYIDGTFIQQQSIVNTLNLSSGFIGRWAVSGGTAYPMKGYMDEIRFTYGMARYTGASYTVAAAPFVGFQD